MRTLFKTGIKPNGPGFLIPGALFVLRWVLFLSKLPSTEKEEMNGFDQICSAQLDRVTGCETLQCTPRSSNPSNTDSHGRVWNTEGVDQAVVHRAAAVSTGCSHLTSVVTVSTRTQNVGILQSPPKGPHPPWTPEEGVPPGPEGAQLFHSSLFRSSVLEPHLHGSTVMVSKVSADPRPPLQLQPHPAHSVVPQYSGPLQEHAQSTLKNVFLASGM